MDAHPAQPDLPASKPNARADVLSARDQQVLRAIAEAAMPPGQFLEGAGAATVEATHRWLKDLPDHVSKAIRGAAWALELSTLPTRRRMFSSLPLEARMEALRAWEQSPSFAARMTLRAVLS